MDPDQFLALVQRLIAGQNRREAVAGAIGGALASIGITTVAESRRKRSQDSADPPGKREKKHRQRKHRGHDKDRHGDESAERLGRHNRKRKRHKDNHKVEKKKKKKHQRKDRCKKNGQPCVRDSKCCSKHCAPNTGTCIRKPAS